MNQKIDIKLIFTMLTNSFLFQIEKFIVTVLVMWEDEM